MTSINPIFTTPSPAAGTTSAASSSASNAASSTLGPNAFITLLTAQLQAQDPLNPMDPNQMVSELTSMNTLQQIIQIRQDLDTLAGAAQPAPTGSGSGGGNSSPASGGVMSQVLNQAFTASPAANSAAALYLQSVSKSQLS